MPTLPASLGSSLDHLGLLHLLLVGLHGLENVQLVLHNLVDCGLLLHIHVLVRDLLLGTKLRKLRCQSLLLLRKLDGVWLVLRDGTWLGRDWVLLRLTVAGTA